MAPFIDAIFNDSNDVSSRYFSRKAKFYSNLPAHTTTTILCRSSNRQLMITDVYDSLNDAHIWIYITCHVECWIHITCYV